MERREWYYTQFGNQYGPLDKVELAEMIKAGAVDSTALFWAPPFGDEWKSLSNSGLESHGSTHQKASLKASQKQAANDVFRQAMVPTGRIGRIGFVKEFGFMAVFTAGLFVGAYYLMKSSDNKLGEFGQSMRSLAFLGVYISIVVMGRRIHDFGYSGWWIAPICVVFLLSEILRRLAQAAQSWEAYVYPAIGGDVLRLALVIVVVFLALKRGQKGANRFGDEP